MRWSGLLLLALLLFSFSSLLYSEVTLTDEEYDTILTALEKSVQDLEQSETARIELKRDLGNSEKIITQLEEEQKISDDIINLLKLESDLLLTSLKMRKKDQIIRDLKIFGLGFLSGNLTGGYAGFKIGITL